MVLESKINDVTRNFDNYIQNYEEEWDYGPSRYFYQKVIEKGKGRKGDYLLEEEFLETVYTAVLAWGMDCRSANMKEFTEFGEDPGFKQEVQGIEEVVLQLSTYEALNELSKKELEEVLNLVEEAHKNMDVMRSNSKLVSNSKTLHFMFPELLIPVDRGSTMKNLFGTEHISIDRVRKSIHFSWQLQKELDIRDYRDERFAFTVPKVIDNAISGMS